MPSLLGEMQNYVKDWEYGPGSAGSNIHSEMKIACMLVLTVSEYG